MCPKIQCGLQLQHCTALQQLCNAHRSYHQSLFWLRWTELSIKHLPQVSGHADRLVFAILLNSYLFRDLHSRPPPDVLCFVKGHHEVDDWSRYSSNRSLSMTLLIPLRNDISIAVSDAVYLCPCLTDAYCLVHNKRVPIARMAPEVFAMQAILPG